MKKIFSLFIISSLFLAVLPGESFAESEENYFIVTAYYSPLPNQKAYLKGNYEAEKILNGEGIAGASGKEVFSGMLAAPKSYNFGTKIYLEGLGVGEVADRGGAIVNAGKRGYEHDRIDIWVGYGDEGLQRALYWGKRKVKGYIVDSNKDVSLDFSKLPAPSWATKGLSTTPKIFTIGLGVGGSKTYITQLQDFLKRLGLYTGELDGVYNNELIDVIHKFQLDNGLIEPGELYGAGYWGKTTRDLIHKMYLNGEFDPENNENSQEEKSTQENQEKSEELAIFNNPVETKEEIILLQTILTNLGLYSGAINGLYNNDLEDTITKYQLENKLIAKIGDAGTGYFGPKTRAALKEDYEEYLKEKELEEQLKKQEEARRKELEEKFRELENMALKEAEKKVDSIGTPSIGEVSPKVRELQVLLKELGYFEYKDTAIFGPVTMQALISYQLDKSIIENENDNGAGVYGPKTKESLTIDLKEKFLQEKLLENDELAELKIEIKSEEEKEISAVNETTF
ncbi:MAG: peptidoglycan-binding protein [Candidatus Gracilibacteria bacterium]|nr:peptidoglycan-binding protein [Candidatus Gracilibacteria bacterium]